MILIVTHHDDLHALAIRRELSSRASLPCHIVECDRVAQREALSIFLSRSDRSGHCRTADGAWIDIGAQKVLWLRRPRAEQVLARELPDETAQDVVENDCAGAFRGLLSSTFRGKWISSYEGLSRGSDKIGQLFAAAQSGWRVPETVVTQSKPEVLALLERHREAGIVVKTVVGTSGAFLLTTPVRNPSAIAASAFQAAPAIYQEKIAGSRHIRLLCFGEHSLAASIDTEDLDWRPNLNVPVSAWAVPEAIHRKVRLTLDVLGLEMGVVDLKETPDGELVWLEVNPQGQFLFLEPLTDLKLAARFSDYLVQAAAVV
ncbi:MAG TPA: hypothetical protein VJV39_15200 [Dongiaceae bacterium]|nr:hypothetical protein [Dongiaceae bacterium]